jgi:hypothetical protein
VEEVGMEASSGRIWSRGAWRWRIQRGGEQEIGVEMAVVLCCRI